VKYYIGAYEHEGRQKYMIYV